MVGVHKSEKIHYAWVIVAVGSLVIFSCIGLARYAYTMLLPAMQSGLGLSYDRMGFIGTTNFCGYLLAVFLSSTLLRRFHARGVISTSLLLVSLCMLGISQSHSFHIITLLYFLTGMGTGFANIPMMALITYWFRSEKRGRAAGLVIGGNGAAIIFAGFLIPQLNKVYGAVGWRSSWLVLGLISLAVTVCAALLLRNHPAEMGLEPLGKSVAPSPDQLQPHEKRGDGTILLKLGLLYMAFGATFMVFGTFIVTTMVKEYGFSEAKAGFYWSCVGFFSLFSGVGFGTLSDKIGRKKGLALVYIVQTIAYLLAGLKLGSAGLLVSIILYGSAVFAIPAIMAAAIGDYLGLSRAASAFATVTIFFALGQTIGPGLAGVIAKATGSFTNAYLLASLLTAAAAIFVATLPKPVTAR